MEDPECGDKWQASGQLLGAREHNYSHWLTLNHAAGWWDLARFLFLHPEAALSAKRDATPLRLLSWLSFRLEPAVDDLIEATMLHLSTVEEVKDIDLLALGTKHLDMETPFESAEALRDHLIELISVRNLRHRPVIIPSSEKRLSPMCVNLLMFDVIRFVEDICRAIRYLL